MKNKVIIITGAAMGLGLASAKELAARGANLALVDYNESSLEEAKKEINKQYPAVKVITVVADVSNEDAVKNYVAETVKAFGRIDGLYNNAGIEGKQAGMTEYDVNIFKKVIDINLMGVYYGMRYAIPGNEKSKIWPHCKCSLCWRHSGCAQSNPLCCQQTRCFRHDKKCGALNTDGMESIQTPLHPAQFLHLWLQKPLSK
jgi:NAD(P)-dependent dehydrogenase (short-subunit alcohol dehydrogenase family)